MEWDKVFNYGMPSALLIFLTWGLWRMILWAREKVVEPMVKSHIELIDTLKEKMPSKTDAMAEMQQASEESAEKQTKMLENLQKSVDKQTDIIELAIREQTQMIEEKEGNGGGGK